MLRLFRIERTDERFSYDMTRGYVVAAQDELDARVVAFEDDNCMDRKEWINETTICEEVGIAKDGVERGVILVDYNAG